MADVSGNAGRGRPRKTYPDLIGEVLQKGRVRSTRNRRACMTRCMNVDEAKRVCGDCSRCREFMYVCMQLKDNFERYSQERKNLNFRIETNGRKNSIVTSTATAVF